MNYQSEQQPSGMGQYGQAMPPGAGQYGQYSQNPLNAAPSAKISGRTPEKLSLTPVSRGLPKMAGTFKGVSDPYATMTVISSKQREGLPVVLGRTET